MKDKIQKTHSMVKEEEDLHQSQREGKMASVVIGTIAFVLSKTVNSSMRNLLIVDIKRGVVVLILVDFFTRGLNQQESTISTGRRTFPPSNQEDKRKEESKKRKKEI